MSRIRSRLVLLVVAFGTICIGSQTGDGAFDIWGPTSSDSFMSYSNIEADGETDDGVDVVVKIRPSRAAPVAAEKTLTIDPGTTYWYHDFSAPSVGWTPASEYWVCELYKHGNPEVWQTDVVFTIVDPP